MTSAAEPNADSREARQQLKPAARSSMAPFSDCVKRAVARGNTDPEVMAELRRCVVDARRRGAKPEDVLVAIRTAWHAATGSAGLVDGGPDMRLLGLIGLALDTYFDRSVGVSQTPEDPPWVGSAGVDGS